ncbi:MAG: hypothetical protein P8N02_08015 [Actinomycetota bacterium]|nr:hypothetical protein [Actinomycetota bacterium]
MRVVIVTPSLPLAPGAELIGAVDRPEDFFARTSLLLCPPARGSGFKIEGLEGLSSARGPVVGRLEAAYERLGLTAQVGR